MYKTIKCETYLQAHFMDPLQEMIVVYMKIVLSVVHDDSGPETL